jgi:hypothetical protein
MEDLVITDETLRTQTACEAAYLLHEAARQLVSPSLILELLQPWTEEDQPKFLKIAAVRNVCILSFVVNLYRVVEIRQHFLTFLFSQQELERLGFPSHEELLGGSDKLRWLEILRHQYAGHAMARWGGNDRPGRLVSANLLGQAWRELGINDLEALVKRLRDVAGKLKQFVQHLNQLFPAVEKFINEDYPLELEKGRLGR